MGKNTPPKWLVKHRHPQIVLVDDLLQPPPLVPVLGLVLQELVVKQEDVMLLLLLRLPVHNQRATMPLVVILF
jgi:hypothetical protein